MARGSIREIVDCKEDEKQFMGNLGSINCSIVRVDNGYDQYNPKDGKKQKDGW